MFPLDISSLKVFVIIGKKKTSWKLEMLSSRQQIFYCLITVSIEVRDSGKKKTHITTYVSLSCYHPVV